MAAHEYAVILAGGKGERFWPLSTSRRPKQLLALLGAEPLIVSAFERCRGIVAPENILVITGAEIAEAARRCLSELPGDNVIGEPYGRDTAAACALACGLVRRRDPQGVFCILAADHVIGDLPVFRRTLCEGLRLAAEQAVTVTIGIQPTEPSTGYGYIECGAALPARNGLELVQARRFVEKPDAARAEEYVRGGRHLWNSGMFVWSVATFSALIARHRPQLQPLLDAISAAPDAAAVRDVMAREYEALEKISVDYALLEKADNVVAARGEFAWDDVGAWPALARHLPPDAEGNAVVGDCAAVDASGNVVYSAGRLTALLGVHDLVVVQAEGVTLVCPKARAQEVRKLVQWLRTQGGHEDCL